MELKCGPDRDLDWMAERLIVEARATLSRKQGADMDGVLSKDQLELRAEREKLTPSGEFDVVTDPGVYGRTRAPDPHRPGPRFSKADDPWRQDVHDSFETTTGVFVPNVTRPEVVGGQQFVPGLVRDPGMREYFGQGRYWHLDRYQRSRIRRLVRKVPAGRPDARIVLKGYLAMQYGVPPWIIDRITL